MPTVNERIARNEERILELQRDWQTHLSEQTGHDVRMRQTELAVDRLIESQKSARRDEDNQYRRLELRLQRQTVTVAVVGVLIAAVSLVVAFHGG